MSSELKVDTVSEKTTVNGIAVDSFKLKDNAKNQNCWTIKDYEFFKSYETIKDCKKELKELY